MALPSGVPAVRAGVVVWLEARSQVILIMRLIVIVVHIGVVVIVHVRHSLCFEEVQIVAHAKAGLVKGLRVLLLRKLTLGLLVKPLAFVWLLLGQRMLLLIGFSSRFQEVVRSSSVIFIEISRLVVVILRVKIGADIEIRLVLTLMISDLLPLYRIIEKILVDVLFSPGHLFLIYLFFIDLIIIFHFFISLQLVFLGFEVAARRPGLRVDFSLFHLRSKLAPGRVSMCHLREHILKI